MTATRKMLALGAVVVLLVSLIGGLIAERAYRTFAGWPDPADPGVTLHDVEVSVARRLPLPELTETELAARLAHGNVVVFDVREADEFTQSHLVGAQICQPRHSASASAPKWQAAPSCSTAPLA
jgi:hypothetical protein